MMNPISEEIQPLSLVLEAVLFAAGQPLTLERLQQVFVEAERPSPAELQAALKMLAEAYQGRALQLVELASGYCFQVRSEWSEWVSRLWEERPGRYSRALLETLALIAYRQPITRAEIEDIRGVAVSSSIIKTLQERDWVRVVGHREVPGRPALYATTRAFLDHFNLKHLAELPSLIDTTAIPLQSPNLMPEVSESAESVVASPEPN